MNCYICPRKCGIDRNTEYGFCGCNDKISVNMAFPHFWEEPCISGTKGSGAIFFEGCQLQCIFCQNHTISGTKRKTISKDDFCDNKEGGQLNIKINCIEDIAEERKILTE